FLQLQNRSIAFDKDEQPVFLAEGPWSLNAAQDMFPDVDFHVISEFKTAAGGDHPASVAARKR
ncbi:MAG: hypothetical protein WEB37_00080, partial [Bacteroidota bacterium]